MKLPWTKKNTTPPPARRQPEPLNSVAYVAQQLTEVREQLRKAEKGKS